MAEIGAKMGEQRRQNKAYSSRCLVLIVEPDHFVAQIEEKAVFALGIHSIVAQSGPEAVSILLEHKGDISLVVMDMDPPGMHISQLISRLKTIKKEIKLILSSGGHDVDIRQNLVLADIDGYIAKPFEIRIFALLLEGLISRQ